MTPQASPASDGLARPLDSVRLALPAEASSIATLQRRAWQQTLPPALAERLLRSVDLAGATASWESAIVRPPLAQFRVLVAARAGRVVGFAVLGPADDPDAQAGEDGLVAEFAVDPQAQRQGHGSRLINAAADTLRADGFVRASWWVRASDDALRRFVTSSGWAPDGAHRELETEDGDARIKVVRLVTAL